MRYTVDRAPKRSPQFRTKKGGYNQRQLIWTCARCQRQHTKKPEQCQSCAAVEMYYFQSRKEADRYANLLLQQSSGRIADLEVHPTFPVYGFVLLNEKPVLLFKYIADFSYVRDGVKVIEDVKPSMDAASFDDVFILKRRVVEKLYGVTITIYAGV